MDRGLVAGHVGADVRAGGVLVGCRLVVGGGVVRADRAGHRAGHPVAGLRESVPDRFRVIHGAVADVPRRRGAA